MAEIKLNAQTLAPAAALIITVVIGLGLYGRVSGLESRIATLDAQVAQLENIQAQVDAVDAELAATKANLRSVASARDDILRTICQILERPVAQCGVS